MPFSHRALVYESIDEMLHSVVPFVVAGLEREQSLHVGLPSAQTLALQDALGSDARQASWADPESDSRRVPTGRRLRSFEHLVRDVMSQHPAGLRVVAERGSGGDDAGWSRSESRFDSVLNVALAPQPVDMLCLFDALLLSDGVIETGIEVHPQLGVGAESRLNPDYVTPEMLFSVLNREGLPVPSGAARREITSPSAARRFVAAASATSVLDARQLDDAAVIVTELVTNSWKAEADRIQLSCWVADDRTVLQVDDNGPGLGDPLAGYRRPPSGAVRGRGLWIVHQLSDVVLIYAGPSGTSVRVELWPTET